MRKPHTCEIIAISFHCQDVAAEKTRSDENFPGGLLHGPVPLLRLDHLLLPGDHVAWCIEGARPYVHPQDGQASAPHSVAGCRQSGFLND